MINKIKRHNIFDYNIRLECYVRMANLHIKTDTVRFEHHLCILFRINNAQNADRWCGFFSRINLPTKKQHSVLIGWWWISASALSVKHRTFLCATIDFDGDIPTISRAMSTNRRPYSTHIIVTRACESFERARLRLNQMLQMFLWHAQLFRQSSSASTEPPIVTWSAKHPICGRANARLHVEYNHIGW